MRAEDYAPYKPDEKRDIYKRASHKIDNYIIK